MPDTTFIYGLNDPRTGDCRYVGKANNPAYRLTKHLSTSSKKRNHRECWISGLLVLGLLPELEIIEEVPVSQWQFWEREYIRVFRAIGFRLVNGTEGGDGIPYPKSGENNPFFGRTHSEESKRKNREAHLGKSGPRGYQHTSAAKEKIRTANLGKKLSLDTRKKMSLSRIGRPTSQRGKPWSAARRAAQEKTHE